MIYLQSGIFLLEICNILFFETFNPSIQPMFNTLEDISVSSVTSTSSTNNITQEMRVTSKEEKRIRPELTLRQ